MNLSTVELLSPAGNFETALSAFEAGADAVYCGLADFSARAFADNFSIEDLKNLMRYARKHGKKVYVTFNTVIDEDSVDAAIEQLARLDEVRPDALIVQDLGVARICRRHFPGLELHASTQLVAHNLEGVLALHDVGFSRVVLARELSLDEIVSISKRCGDVELECFIHGALCYSISGLCLFGAMEKGRSGNRGKCPYCCRLPYENAEGEKTLAFSMKDMRVGEDVRKLVEAGVASLKIEGRMKSALYVASVTRYYRQILGVESKAVRAQVTVADLETVFSRRTTQLYLNGRAPEQSPIDPTSLGHLGAEIGVVKRVTKDRDGIAWLRFHTARGLEKHDGLQFEAMVDGKHVGMGVVEMRQAISRRPVFEVNAGTDVEVQVSEEVVAALRPGMKIYCSMSNAVKRLFPAPSFRPSDYAGDVVLDLEVTLAPDGMRASAELEGGLGCTCSVPCDLSAAKNPEKTRSAVEKAFGKLGDTDYRLGKLTLHDPDRLFAPMSVLNDVRRDLAERLDELRDKARRDRVGRAVADVEEVDLVGKACSRVKIRAGQAVPSGAWDELIVSIGIDTASLDCAGFAADRVRLAVPVYTAEPEFNKLRSAVKRFMREGYSKWEASDLATLRMLKALGVKDITADWTLYAFNSRALAELSALGVRRFVASPENCRENLQYLAESGYDVEFLSQQSTPLFVSLTKPMDQVSLAVCRRNNIWVTTRNVPRTFDLPEGVSVRLDLSWDPA